MKVKREWAKALLGVKQFEVYVSMRARIALRKHGCIPLEDKKKEKTVIEKEIESVKANNGRPVDAGDIIRALERGDEVRLFFHFLPHTAFHMVSENRYHPYDLHQIRLCFREGYEPEIY